MIKVLVVVKKIPSTFLNYWFNFSVHFTHPQSITKVLNAKDLLDTLLLGSCAELKNLVIRYEDMGTYLTSNTSSPSEPLSLTSLLPPLPTDH